MSFDIARGEVLGLVGESGCGKTTTGRVIVGLESPTEGDVFINDQSCQQLKHQSRKQFYRMTQMIFQDPYGSINPRHNVTQILSRPLRYQGINDKKRVNPKVSETLELVGLSPDVEYLDKYPHQLSGRQRQRLCIGRAIILDPINLPPGCRFSPRCPRAVSECARTEPNLKPYGMNDNHKVACYRPLEGHPED